MMEGSGRLPARSIPSRIATPLGYVTAESASGPGSFTSGVRPIVVPAASGIKGVDGVRQYTGRGSGIARRAALILESRGWMLLGGLAALGLAILPWMPGSSGTAWSGGRGAAAGAVSVAASDGIAPGAALDFAKGERIGLLGNSLAERMGLFGNFETGLHLRFPDRELVVRSFARPAEEVGVQQRSADYTQIDDPQHVFRADSYLVFFGYNESFAGPQGLPAFREQYGRYLDRIAREYPRTEDRGAPRFILVGPIAVESPEARSFLPEGAGQNANLELYDKAIGEIARERGLVYVSLWQATAELFAREAGLQYTINGCHLNEAGDAAVADLLQRGLFGDAEPECEPARREELRKGVVDKAWVHQQDYRMLNGWYVYGGRRTWDTGTFPLEYAKIRKMAAVRDREVWEVAAGRKSAYQPVDDETGELLVPPTRFGDPGQKYSEAEELRYLTPDEFIAQTEVPAGFEIRLFADETRFPEIAKPVQLNFDNRGRLWVACMPTYPQWKPGDAKPQDKLVILEDRDNDGQADHSTVFYDQLHCPTGFEFWNGGVLVVDQPRLLFLKDTDGDDRADQVVHLMDGWASDDTHHSCGAFEWNHGGKLHMLEGIATSTTLETPWGPHRSRGDGGAYVLEPEALKIRQFSLPGQYNMWCYVFDEWGQGIVGDGTTANHAWDTPLSGAPFRGRTGLDFVFDNEGMRPALGCEFLVSRHFPDEVQKQFCYACVINMNGMPRFSLGDSGGGFAGKRLKKPDGSPDDLIRSDDKHFRPADPQIGPDGALWFGDWANALIGHMQYSQRDPNRDHVRGRIYRLVYPERPLVEAATQFGKSVPEILEQLRAPEWRTRYRARRELRDRPAAEVRAALDTWLQGLSAEDPEYDRLRCEALWVQQGLHQLDAALLEEVALRASRPEARAAALHIVADERERLSGALKILLAAVSDPHPRVRTEVARGLGFFPVPEAMQGLFGLASGEADYWADYTIVHSLGANETVWRGDYLSGKVGADNPRAQGFVTRLFASNEAGAKALPHLQVLLSNEARTEEFRNKAMTALADLKGDQGRGQEVFERNCISCHRVGTREGREFGPNLLGVATRMNRLKIVQSIIDPNAEVAEKYLSTLVLTLDGTVISGLLTAETPAQIEIFDGKELRKIPVEEIEERKIQKQSSMPEGTALTIAPSEFVDLIEYLAAQNQPDPNAPADAAGSAPAAAGEPGK